MDIKLLSILLLLTGIALAANGVIIKTDDILASAGLAVDQANIHQFEIALELYYSDHNTYPNVIGGSALIDELKRENYISENRQVEADSFDYQVNDNGQNYSLKLKSK